MPISINYTQTLAELANVVSVSRGRDLQKLLQLKFMLTCLSFEAQDTTIRAEPKNALQKRFKICHILCI